MDTKQEFALEFVRQGISIIPTNHRAKTPAAHLIGGTWEQYRKTLPSEYDVQNWLGCDWQNYAVVLGWRDLAVVDFDDLDVYAMWLEYYESVIKKYNVLEWDADPFTVMTGRGAHVYITHPNTIRVNSNRSGIDIKINGLVTGAMSVHPSGAVYRPLGKMYFPTVYDLDVMLPPEIFPPTAAPVSILPSENLQFIPRDENDLFAPAFENTVQKIKHYHRIENLFPEREKTSADGRWYAVKCLFHEDKNASAWIDAARGLFGCHACNMRPMDVINLYAKQHNCSDAQAIAELARAL